MQGGGGIDGFLEFVSVEQPLTSWPLQSSSKGCCAVLGPSDTPSPGPIQDPRSRVNHVPLYALSQVTCPGTLAMTQICFLLSGWPWTVGSN